MSSPTVSPDYLPARMLNEFVYCPRLFYYEWVEGVFADNRETVEGAIRHSKLDGKQDDLAPAEELDADVAKASQVSDLLKTCLLKEPAPGLDPARRKILSEFASQERRHLGLENAVIKTEGAKRHKPSPCRVSWTMRLSPWMSRLRAQPP